MKNKHLPFSGSSKHKNIFDLLSALFCRHPGRQSSGFCDTLFRSCGIILSSNELHWLHEKDETSSRSVNHIRLLHTHILHLHFLSHSLTRKNTQSQLRLGNLTVSPSSGYVWYECLLQWQDAVMWDFISVFLLNTGRTWIGDVVPDEDVKRIKSMRVTWHELYVYIHWCPKLGSMQNGLLEHVWQYYLHFFML